MTLISVVTPSFNQARYLDAAIRSVRGQACSHLVEHIVIDGGSTDQSVEILKRHSDWLAYWHSKPDDGQSAAINEGFCRANGDIFCWINSDDGLAPGASEFMIDTLGGLEGPAWAFGGALVVDKKDKLLERRSISSLRTTRELLLSHNSLMQPAVFWNREMWEEVGGLNEKLNYVMDFDLWLRFMRVAPAIRIDGDIGIHRIHEMTKTANGGTDLYKELRSVLQDNIGASADDYEYGLRSITRDMTHHANASMFSLNRTLSLEFLRLAFTSDPVAAFNTSAFKALVKIVNPFQVDKSKGA